MVTVTPPDKGCPRTSALLEEISRLGYSAANDRVTSLCWDLERELTKAQTVADGISAEYVKTRLALQDAQHALTASGDLLKECADALEAGLESDGDYERGWSRMDRELVAKIRAILAKETTHVR